MYKNIMSLGLKGCNINTLNYVKSIHEQYKKIYRFDYSLAKSVWDSGELTKMGNKYIFNYNVY